MPDQVTIVDLTVGTGATPTQNSVVSVTYSGTFADGSAIPGASVSTPVELSLFDDAPPNTPTQAVLIPGFITGVLGMKEGGTRKVTIPASLAYGTDGLPPDSPVVPPNAILIFTIALIKVLGFSPRTMGDEVSDDVSPPSVTEMFDLTRYRKPMTPGSAVTVIVTDTGSFGIGSTTQRAHTGTLGCFAQTTDTNQIVALTNYHVLHDVSVDKIVGNNKNFPVGVSPSPPLKALGRLVGQPTDASPSACCKGVCTDIVGQVYDAILSDQVDGSIVDLTPDLSYQNTLPGIGLIAGTTPLPTSSPPLRHQS